MGTVAVDSTLALTNSKGAVPLTVQMQPSLRYSWRLNYTPWMTGERSVLGAPSKHSRNPKYTVMVLNTNLLMGCGLHDIVPEPFDYVWSSSVFVTTSNLFSKLFLDLFICLGLLALIPHKPESNLTFLTTVADIIQSQSILICCHDTNSLWPPHLQVKYQSKGNQLIDNFRTATS